MLTPSRALLVYGLPAALVVAAFSYHAGAVRPLAAKPTAVGVVDLAAVLEKVNDRAQWDANVKRLEEEIRAEAQTRDAEIKSSQEKVREMADGADRDTLAESLARRMIEADAWFKHKTTVLDREKALMWQDLYRTIRQEAESLAIAEGVELVLVNDSVAEIRTSTDGSVRAEVLVLQQITARRVLYAAKEIDLTDRLVTRMNNAAAAGARTTP